MPASSSAPQIKCQFPPSMPVRSHMPPHHARYVPRHPTGASSLVSDPVASG